MNFHRKRLLELKKNLKPFTDRADPNKVKGVLLEKIESISPLYTRHFLSKPQERELIVHSVIIPPAVSIKVVKKIIQELRIIPCRFYLSETIDSYNIEPTKVINVVSIKPYALFTGEIINYILSTLHICLVIRSEQLRTDARKIRRKLKKQGKKAPKEDARQILSSEMENYYDDLILKLMNLRLDFYYDHLQGKIKTLRGINKIGERLYNYNTRYLNKHGKEL